MAINTTRLATLLGSIFGGANEINTYRQTTVTNRAATIVTNGTAGVPTQITGVYDARDAAIGSEAGWMSYLQQLTANAIIQEVNNDRNIPLDDIASALNEWKRQMLIAGDNFAVSTASFLTITAIGSPTGASYQFLVNDYDGTGQKSDFCILDNYILQVTNDKDHGGTRWAETFSVVGKQAADNVTDFDYSTSTKGAGINTTITAHDPAAGTGLISDPGFDLWTSNTPTDWTLGPSTLAGTHVFKGTDDPRSAIATGTCLDFKGDGAVIPKLRQRVDSQIVANGVYAVHFRIKKVNDPSTDWAVTVRLVDSTGAALAGPNAYSNSKSSAASTSVTADWANPYTAIFIAPSAMPSDGIVYLEIVFHQSGSLTTAPVNLAEVYVDHVDMVEASFLYAMGPSLNVFSGTTSAVNLDAWTFAVVVPTVSSSMIRWINRMVDLRGLGIRLPTNGTGTQADALIS